MGCWVAGFGFCVGLLWFWVLRFGWVSFLLWVGGFSCDSLGVLPAVLVLLWGWYNMGYSDLGWVWWVLRCGCWGAWVTWA